MNTSTIPTVLNEAPARRAPRFLRVIAEPQTYRNFLYLVLGLPLGTIWFSVLVTGIAVGTSLLVVALLGVPVLLAMWYAIRAFANTERAVANVLLGTSVAPAGFGPHGSGNLWRRLRALCADGRRRRELWFVLLRFPMGIATFTAATVALAVPFSLAYAPVAARTDGDQPFGDWAYSERLEQTFDSAWSWASVGAAVILLVVALNVTNQLAAACRHSVEHALGAADLSTH